MTKLAAQKRLAILWFNSSALLGALFVVFTLLDRFGDQNAAAWQWYSQNIIPTLTLIIGSFYASATASPAPADAPQADSFSYHLCFYISLFYLLALLLTVLAAPLAQHQAGFSLPDLLNASKTYLILLQGITSYALGMFFVKNHMGA